MTDEEYTEIFDAVLNYEELSGPEVVSDDGKLVTGHFCSHYNNINIIFIY